MTVNVNPAEGDEQLESDRPRRVAYLLGAGATKGSVEYSGRHVNLLMSELRDDLGQEISGSELGPELVDERHLIDDITNQVVVDEADIEHLTTFLEDAPSAVHRKVANLFRDVFHNVLARKLEEATSDEAPSHSDLYAALVDMHRVPGNTEELTGILTLNYDAFLEHAIETHLRLPVDYGVTVASEKRGESDPQARPVRVLKMHGSFSWTDSWPMGENIGRPPGRWIPPGIRKAKQDYPFNAIWGLAREVLDCDVLRIIGCELKQNDWDLISLLFTTRHARRGGRPPYVVEVIASPSSAERIRKRFSYLGVRSILELDEIGETVVGEILGSSIPLSRLDPSQLREVKKAADEIENPFAYWLRQMGEIMVRDLPTIRTPMRKFESFVTGSFDEWDLPA